MAGKTIKEKRDYAKSDALSVQWVNVTLSDDDIQALTAWVGDFPDLLPEFLRLVTEGYAVSVKPARDGDGFMATLISPVHATSGQSFGVSAYASDGYGALACLLFKFVTKLGGEFPTTVGKGRPAFR